MKDNIAYIVEWTEIDPSGDRRTDRVSLHRSKKRAELQTREILYVKHARGEEHSFKNGDPMACKVSSWTKRRLDESEQGYLWAKGKITTDEVGARTFIEDEEEEVLKKEKAAREIARRKSSRKEMYALANEACGGHMKFGPERLGYGVLGALKHIERLEDLFIEIKLWSAHFCNTGRMPNNMIVWRFLQEKCKEALATYPGKLTDEEKRKIANA